MPARRRKRSRKSTKKKQKKKLNLRLIGFIVFASLILFSIFSTKHWKKNEKTTLSTILKNGDVVVSVFDPANEKISNIYISGDFQISAARQYGTWKLKSIRKLGQTEGYGGLLVSESLTNNFKFLVDAWADEGAIGFSNGNFGRVMGSIFAPYKSNLGVGDRIRLGLFSLGVKNTKREDIDLSKYTVVNKKILVDGSGGYVLAGKLPNSLYALFSDPIISKRQISASIVDASKREGLTSLVSELVEVVGVKVVSTVEEPSRDIDCEVSGLERGVVEKIAEIFNCKEIIRDVGSIDVEIKFGEDFAGRF